MARGYERLAAAVVLSLIGGAASGQDAEKVTAEPVAEYVIGVEDRLNISVWHEADLIRTVTVRPDGKITFPLAGDIQAAGKTPHDLDDEMTKALARFIKEPVVTVIVEEINHFKVYVLGEVHTQGQLQLRRRTRLLQAIALAGGLTQYADKANVVVVREQDGRETRMRVDYRKLLTGDKPETNYFLMPGDTIIAN